MDFYSNTWEEIDSNEKSDRLKVPGGWIVRSWTGSMQGGVHQIFIKDDDHTWVLCTSDN